VAVRRLVVAAVVVGARLGVQQDGGDHGLHIAPDAFSVIGESRGHPLHVSRARIALHQVLDQQLSCKRPDIGMVEDIVERVDYPRFSNGLIAASPVRRRKSSLLS